MNILVTGCAGFIASKVAQLLLEQGHAVHGVDNLAAPSGDRLRQWWMAPLRQHSAFAFRRLDISDLESLRPIFRGSGGAGRVEAVFNLGALAGVRSSVLDPQAFYEANVMGTLNLLELCREFGVGKFIRASTYSVYGDAAPARSVRTPVPAGPFRPTPPPRRPRKPCCILPTTFMGWMLPSFATSPCTGRRAART